jgi:hypothetical protein
MAGRFPERNKGVDDEISSFEELSLLMQNLLAISKIDDGVIRRIHHQLSGRIRKPFSGLRSKKGQCSQVPHRQDTVMISIVTAFGKEQREDCDARAAVEKGDQLGLLEGTKQEWMNSA